MKKLMLMMMALMMCFNLIGQKDTIFTTKGKSIVCEIIFVNDKTNSVTKGITYNIVSFTTDLETQTTEQRFQHFIPMTKVSRYYKAEPVITSNIQKDSLIKNEPIKTLIYKDSIKILFESYDKLYSETKKINLQLNKFHQEYKTGTTTLVVGLILTGLGTTWMITRNNTNDMMAPAVVIGIGGICSTIGAIIQIDSHKHLP